MRHWFRIFFSILILGGFVSCGFIERLKMIHNDEKIVSGVFISTLGDYRLKHCSDGYHFKQDHVFLSNVFLDSYSYYIFWKDGRCLYSDGRDLNGVSLESVLNNRTGTAGYYKISNDTLTTERYTDGVFIYQFYLMSTDKMNLVDTKIRKPFKDRMTKGQMWDNFYLFESYTQFGADSVYFNSDSVALWQPFW